MVTKGHGLSVDDIDWSCPADLEPYEKAYKLEQKEIDARLYSMGLYNKIAFEVVMSHVSAGFSGKKSKAKYLEKPLLDLLDFEKEKNGNKESNEEVAVFEMHKRIKALKEQGLPESPI